MKLAVERSTTKVFSLVGALAVLRTLLFATSALAAPKEGPTGPTGATGPTGPAGEKGATGPAGTEKNEVACQVKEGPELVRTGCTLASGYMETGTWSVHIEAPTGAPQAQYESPISFPVRLKREVVVKATYRNERQAEEPTPPCTGNVNEPTAEPGNLCVYRGSPLGGLESEDRNAAFFEFTDPAGNFYRPVHGLERMGRLGEMIVFRSVNNSPAFTEEVGEAPGVITEAAYMEGGGTWAITEK